jgi:hypothetical protein
VNEAEGNGSRRPGEFHHGQFGGEDGAHVRESLSITVAL